MIRATLPCLCLAGLAACQFPAPSSEQLQARAVCRQEANRIYAAQNRAQLSQRDTSYAPFSANTLPSDPTRGLYSQYGYQQIEDQCLNGRNTAPSSTGPAGAPAALPPPSH